MQHSAILLDNIVFKIIYLLLLDKIVLLIHYEQLIKPPMQTCMARSGQLIRVPFLEISPLTNKNHAV